MKSYAFLICTFFVHLAAAAQTYNGFVNRMNTTFFFQPEGSRIVYQMTSQESEVLTTLSRLQPGDYITASGLLDPVQRTFKLDSIDFVGLERLLGPWISLEGSMVFKNFNTLFVRPLSGGPSVEFRYSISPSDDDGEWVMFVSDTQKTYYATLHIDPFVSTNASSTLKRFQLKIYSSESGHIVGTYKLERP
jgi:hypothetical protein